MPLLGLSRDVDEFLRTMPQGDPRLDPVRESVRAAANVLAANERGDDLGGFLHRMQQAADGLPPATSGRRPSRPW